QLAAAAAAEAEENNAVEVRREKVSDVVSSESPDDVALPSEQKDDAEQNECAPVSTGEADSQEDKAQDGIAEQDSRQQEDMENQKSTSDTETTGAEDAAGSSTTAPSEVEEPKQPRASSPSAPSAKAASTPSPKASTSSSSNLMTYKTSSSTWLDPPTPSSSSRGPRWSKFRNSSPGWRGEDLEDFRHTLGAMQAVGIAREHTKKIFDAIAAVLHLRSVEFDSCCFLKTSSAGGNSTADADEQEGALDEGGTSAGASRNSKFLIRGGSSPSKLLMGGDQNYEEDEQDLTTHLGPPPNRLAGGGAASSLHSINKKLPTSASHPAAMNAGIMGTTGKGAGVAASLANGNASSTASSSSRVDLVTCKNPEQLQLVETLLGVQDLANALCHKVIGCRGEQVKSHLRLEQVLDNRDSLARHLYGLVFNDIVAQANACISCKSSSSSPNTERSASGGEDGRPECSLKTDDQQQQLPAPLQGSLFIGVLDIFGFECFLHNSYEQLCINYANERLQQFFNHFVFLLEESLYHREQVPWDPVDFPDNRLSLELLQEKVTGVFHVLDEECMVVRGSDQGLVNKLTKVHSDHPRFQVVKLDRSAFVVKHFAGDVRYSSHRFLDKNKDQLSVDLIQCIKSSHCSYISSLFHGDARYEAPIPGRKRKIKTISAEFRGQLQHLLEKIDLTDPHFVRCIKSNAENVSTTFHRRLVTEQLRYSGVIQVVQISRSGYPVRIPHRELWIDYRCVVPHAGIIERLGGVRVSLGLPGASSMNRDRDRVPLKKRITTLMDLACEKWQISTSTCSTTATGVSTSIEAGASKNAAQFQVGKTLVFFKKAAFAKLYRARAETRQTSAASIQNFLRMAVQRIAYLRVRFLMTKLQARVRGSQQRRRFRIALKEYRAAAKIQAFVRMSIVRGAYIHLIKSSAPLIQRCVRGLLGRQRVKRIKARQEELEKQRERQFRKPILPNGGDASSGGRHPAVGREQQLVVRAPPPFRFRATAPALSSSAVAPMIRAGEKAVATMRSSVETMLRTESPFVQPLNNNPRATIQSTSEYQMTQNQRGPQEVGAPATATSTVVTLADQEDEAYLRSAAPYHPKPNYDKLHQEHQAQESQSSSRSSFAFSNSCSEQHQQRKSYYSQPLGGGCPSTATPTTTSGNNLNNSMSSAGNGGGSSSTRSQTRVVIGTMSSGRAAARASAPAASTNNAGSGLLYPGGGPSSNMHQQEQARASTGSGGTSQGGLKNNNYSRAGSGMGPGGGITRTTAYTPRGNIVVPPQNMTRSAIAFTATSTALKTSTPRDLQGGIVLPRPTPTAGTPGVCSTSAQQLQASAKNNNNRMSPRDRAFIPGLRVSLNSPPVPPPGSMTWQQGPLQSASMVARPPGTRPMQHQGYK
ncbi:unnamed protein product, partial [Amoebophrya sp. A25]